jgi:hypothetical protein
MNRAALIVSLALVAMSLQAQSPVTILNPTPIVIDVTTMWTPTGIQINAGKVFSVHVEGVASASHPSSTSHWNWYGPEGWGDYVPSSGFPLNGVAACGVIAKIGDAGAPFFVGKHKTFRADTSGALFFGYNDSEYGDNFGYFLAFVDTSLFPTGLNMVEDGGGVVKTHLLLQNYPNPFNPSTTISYVLPSRANVELQIFDMSGRLVKALVSEEQESGSHTAVWNGQDQAGNAVASGTYFYRVDSDGRQLAKKMLLLK